MEPTAMFRIDNSTASTTLPPQKPVGVPGFFTAGTVGGVPATIVEADWMNTVQEELMAILGAAGVTPSKPANNQVITSILDLIASNTRLRLTGPLDLYVNAATGSDANNGLTPTTAWATPQAAWNYIIQRLDCGSYQITVHIADGTYPTLTCAGALTGVQNVPVIFQGDVVNPASVVISGVNNPAVLVERGAAVGFDSLRLQANGIAPPYSPEGIGLCVLSTAQATISNVDFGACTAQQMLARGGSIATLEQPYSISANAPTHMQADSGGQVTTAYSAVTITNTPTFSYGFASAAIAGTLTAGLMTFTGAAHGPRYQCTTNGIIGINGSNPNTYFPGDVNGSTASGGQVI
jgi:hypothetical protein